MRLDPLFQVVFGQALENNKLTEQTEIEWDVTFKMTASFAHPAVSSPWLVCVGVSTANVPAGSETPSPEVLSVVLVGGTSCGVTPGVSG